MDNFRLPQVKEIASRTMGAIGWIKSAKGAVFACVQAGVAGYLQTEMGWPVVAAQPIGAAASIVVNVAWQFLRKYEVVEK